MSGAPPALATDSAETKAVVKPAVTTAGCSAAKRSDIISLAVESTQTPALHEPATVANMSQN